MDPSVLRSPTLASSALAWLCLVAGALLLIPAPAGSAEMPRGEYWYAPEHEKYSRTEFFSQPSFRSAQVRITSTRRFRYLGGQRDWAQLEFDGGTRAFIHLRILRLLLYDPDAIDPWYEFQRASVFPEDPEKIEARLKPARTETPSAESKLPVWKRYKEGWSINRDKGRSGAGDHGSTAGRPPEKKGRNPYSMLPPIGSQPADAGSPDPASPDDGAAAGSR